MLGPILLREGNRTGLVCVPSVWSDQQVFEYAVKRLSEYPGSVWDITGRKQDHVYPTHARVELVCKPIPKEKEEA